MADKKPNFTGKPPPKSDYPPGSSITGTCLCGSISLTITDPELFARPRSYLCHCANCRKTSGSYVSANLMIEKEKVELKDRNGTLKVFQDYATGSGKPVSRFFCGVDGNPIKSETPNFPSMIIAKMGMFPRIPDPELEAFSEHRHEWQDELDGLVQYRFTRGGEKLEK